MFFFLLFIQILLTLLEVFFKCLVVMRHLQGTGSFLAAHPLMHLEPRDAQCRSERVVYTGTEGSPFGGGARGHNTECIQIWSIFRQFGIVLM